MSYLLIIQASVQYIRKVIKIKTNFEDYKFIKNFTEITISKICQRLNIPRTSLITGSTSDENIRRVRKEIEKEYAKLYLE